MSMDESKRTLERGQSLVLVTIMLVVMIGVLAFVIDGGVSYANRRSAQNAADAGALAGAREMCAGKTYATVYNRAQEYIVMNEADPTTINIDLSARTIEVTATIPYSTFLANIIDIPEMTTNARASAGCFSPCTGEGVLPVAWSCHPPVGSPITDTCTIEYGTVDNPGPHYIFMDSTELGSDLICKNPVTGEPTSGIDCDLNNDGINDTLSSGERSWLDLNGEGGGAAELIDWILNGFNDFPLHRHMWIPDQSGVSNSIFDAVKTRIDDVVILPVFNQFCVGDPPTNCSGMYHWSDPEEEVIPAGATSTKFFHIDNFSAIKVDCVDAPPKAIPGAGVSLSPSKHCPTFQTFIDQNPTMNPGDINKLKVIEGYFVEGFVPGIGGNCGECETGLCTIYLNH